MSIYATLWTLKFPREGDETLGGEWITVRAQAVPAHIGTPTPRHGYEGGDPYAAFLPPPVAVDAQGRAPFDRAVDIPALGLVPLRLEDRGLWNPQEHYWGEDNEPIEEWGQADHRPRPETGVRDGASPSRL